MFVATYRPYNQSSVNTIVQVRSSGHYRIDYEYHEKKPPRPFIQLFWVVTGRCRFNHSSGSCTLRPGEVFCYFQKDLHNIQIGKEGAEYYWLTFDGPFMDLLVTTFSFSHRPHQAGKCPVALFTRLENELKDFSTSGELRAGATCYKILSLASIHCNLGDNTVTESFRDIVENNFHNHCFGIAEAAEMLGMHRTSLTRILTATIRITPTEYLLNFRVQEALSRLQNSNDSIKIIADECGFRDQSYFCKIIQRRFGHPPSEFRSRRDLRPTKTLINP